MNLQKIQELIKDMQKIQNKIENEKEKHKDKMLLLQLEFEEKSDELTKYLNL